MYFMVPKEFVPFALQNRDHLDANDMSYFTESFLTSAFSVEFCGGPHVKNTFELSDNGTKKFKILKEEASSAGVRRIKATLV